MPSKNILFIILDILPLLLRIEAQHRYPDVICPEIFKYAHEKDLGGHVGFIKMRKDESPIFELEVNMTMSSRTPINDNIKIVILSSKDDVFYGDSIDYAVKFPSQNNIPILTAVKFNGKTVCHDNPGPLEPGVIQTSMWAKSIIHTFGTQDKAPPSISPTPTQNNPFQYSLIFGAQPNTFDLPINLPNNPFLPQNGDRVWTMSTTSTTKPLPQTPRTIAITPFSTATRTSPTPIPEVTTSFSSRSRTYQCGTTRNSQNLILGGEGISPGEFPWLAAIMYRQNTDYKLHCTGNLITDQHVLTAGHCVRYHNAPLFDNSDLIIILGKLNMGNWASGGVIKTAKLVETHPNYKQDHADYDIAMIVLNEPVQFRPTIRPICLWDKDENLSNIVGTFGTVVGWNRDGSGDLDVSAQKVELPIVSQETCLRSNKVFSRYTSTRTFCAGTRDNRKGPCTGDSGAGFMIRDESSRKWFLRGLVGFSLKDPITLTCDLTNYVIFIDVAKILPWIDDQMKKV